MRSSLALPTVSSELSLECVWKRQGEAKGWLLTIVCASRNCNISNLTSDLLRRAWWLEHLICDTKIAGSTLHPFVSVSTLVPWIFDFQHCQGSVVQHKPDMFHFYAGLCALSIHGYRGLCSTRFGQRRLMWTISSRCHNYDPNIVSRDCMRPLPGQLKRSWNERVHLPEGYYM